MAAIRPLSDAELDRLEALLGSDALGDTAMSLDAAQALICAVASGPQEVLPDVWLPVVFGIDGDWTQIPEAQEATLLLRRLRDEIALDLYEGNSVGPILYPKTEGGEDFDFATWALGYLEGVDLSDPTWEESTPSDEIDDLLLPLLILAGGLEHDPTLRQTLELSAQEEAAFVARCQDELSESIQDIYDFWAEVRRPRTVRRETAKVGRNDPCPCGSGRKYKLCHGADA